MRFRAWFLVVLLLCLYVAADSTTCSATKRCEQGCCNKNGNCGFGPDYCGKSVCRSDCKRLSECDPGFGSAWAKNEKCPLNVCCSKHGYCGTTKDFCGSNTVKRPSCSKGKEMERVVGYFEGWAKDRPCEVFWPEQIPTGLYTHINFAFGNINPNTFLLEANAPEDTAMYERLALLKKRDPNLKIYLAIGGWTFNDPGPTARVFSDLAASESLQSKFFDSVQSFMTTHKFDGLDLDWEYPVDTDRGGREYDYKTFPEFMEKLKKMLNTGDKGLTITLPASYWYLQYFDIKKLEPNVDFFNIMSYDLHGAWDQNVNWTKPYLNAHTNLTEVDLSLDLLWRNGISPGKVVMGLGFYGRAFTLDSPSCTEPGCLFTKAANAGTCSRERGILLNSEIDKLIEKHELEPKLYKEEAVKVVTWNKQWVSYDDKETLQMKVDRAGERCLGGVMVWAISHDTQDAKYNMALANILDRKVVNGSIDNDEKSGDWTNKPYKQCRWSNCKESCPKGWVHVRRSDPDRNDDRELMYDETGCGGDGHHSFCCPPEEDIPTCGWYGHDGGKCTKSTSCPPKMVEIGSNQMHCNDKPRVQTACCDTDSESMKAYATCKWGVYPECNADDPSCPYENYPTELIASGGGSGGLQCNNLKNDLGVDVLGVQSRKYCCNEHDNVGFHDCHMYRTEGPTIAGANPSVCLSNCPSDRVRVAIDWPFHICSAYEVGGQAWCCKTKHSKRQWEPNEKLVGYKETMTEWANAPTCPNPSQGLGSRGLSSSSTELAVRADKGEALTPLRLLTNILGLVGSQVVLAQYRLIYNSAVRPVYPWIQTTYLSRYIRLNWIIDWEGPAAFARKIICNPRYWADKIKAALEHSDDAESDSDIFSCANVTSGYCDINGDCDYPSGDDTAHRRRQVNLFGRHSAHSAHSLHHHHHSHALLNARAELKLTIKGPDEDKDPDDPRSNEGEYLYIKPGHPSIDEILKLRPRSPVLDQMVVFQIPELCHAPTVSLISYKDRKSDEFQVEHLVDWNILKAFFEGSAKGKLVSGATSKYGPIPLYFWDQMADTNLALEPGVPMPLGNTKYARGSIIDRAHECLGSKTNNRNFFLVDTNINAAKNYVFRFNRPMRDETLMKYLGRKDKKVGIKFGERVAKSRFRAAMSTFFYMDVPEVHEKFNKIIRAVHVQFKFAEKVFNKGASQKIQLSDYWIEWITDYYAHVVTDFREKMGKSIKESRRILEEFDDQGAANMRRFLDSVEKQLGIDKFMKIDTSGFPKIGAPDSGPVDEDEDEDEDEDAGLGGDDGSDEDSSSGGDEDSDEEMGGT